MSPPSDVSISSTFLPGGVEIRTSNDFVGAVSTARFMRRKLHRINQLVNSAELAAALIVQWLRWGWVIDPFKSIFSFGEKSQSI